MAKITTLIDKEAARLAKEAALRVKRTAQNRADVFATLVKKTAKQLSVEKNSPATPEWMQKISRNAGMVATEEELLRELRFDLEAALLRLDATARDSLTSVKRPKWPNKGDLDNLKIVVAKTARQMGKRPPRTFWQQCQMLDRHFPRLKACSRIEKFLERSLDIEPRPLGQIMCSNDKAGRELSRTFLGLVADVRQGKRKAAEVDWLPFEQLLLAYRNANGKRRHFMLLPTKYTGQAPNTALAYIAFLELECADLLWTQRHFNKLWKVALWAMTLGNREMAAKFEPFLPGPESFTGTHEEIVKTAKRFDAKTRQARRRKKIAKSRDTFGKG